MIPILFHGAHERRHDLNIVLNARFAKRWAVGSQFVLASGLPYTKAEEAYLLNGNMICRYSTFNGEHLPLYNRLDLSCSCDIIKKQDRELGINLSLYNVYCHMMEILTSSIFGNNVCGIIPSPVVGEIEYQMWDSYIAQNMTQGLFFMETHSNIISNIQGGNGYWCGMGASEYAIKLDKEKLYTFTKQPNN